jgi:hypothetical protein
LERQGHQEHLDHQEFLDLLAEPVLLGLLVQWDPREKWGLLVQWDHQDKMDLLAQKALVALVDPLAFLLSQPLLCLPRMKFKPLSVANLRILTGNKNIFLCA